MYQQYIKRLFDVVLSFFALLFLSPLIVGIALLILIKLGRPILFKQLRPGKNEKIFVMYKFRSMIDLYNKDGTILPDEKRLTSFGKTLRSTSLDELPELFNILRGDMSIVGPRPQLVRDMVFMTAEQRIRHQVLPGLTGLAQVNGRNEISWEEKFKWDLYYIRHLSFRTDCAIIIKTIFKVLKKEDITTEGMDTAEDLGDYLLRNNLVDSETYKQKQILASKLLSKVNKYGWK